MEKMEKPKTVTTEEWERARDELRVAEKEATRALDALAARRRRLPMAKVSTDYGFETPAGTRSLLELFDGREQLATYQFMDNGPEHYCPGCTWATNNIPASAPALLAEKGITWVTISDMPLAQLQMYWKFMGWTLPFASSRGTSFSKDIGAGAGFQLSIFLRDGTDVYRTYSTTARGIERLNFVTGILDLTVYGRREDWEDSPKGWPQSETYIVPTTMELGRQATGYGRFR